MTKQKRSFRLRRPFKGFGEMASYPQSISGWWGDQAELGPPPTSTAAQHASPIAEERHSPTPTEMKADIERTGTSSTTTPERLKFDFDAPPEPPRYVVDGLFERATVNVISSDTGIGKTWMSCSLIAAALAEASWLDRSVEARRVIVVDEENPAAVIRSRLRAFGATTEQADEQLRYFSRQGISLGEERWNEWLIEQAVEHAADLILVDTAMVATALGDVNDNTEVANIYKSLRKIAEDTDAAIVLFHHHRKSQGEKPRCGGQEMMGGRQWAGQADAHITLGRRGDTTEQETEDGSAVLLIEFRVEKLRNGKASRPEELKVTIRNEDGCLLTAAAESLGAVEREPSQIEVVIENMLEVLTERGELSSQELYELVGEDASQRTLERARKQAVDGGLIVRCRKGVYRAADGEPEI